MQIGNSGDAGAAGIGRLVRVVGRAAMNRALDGDVVAVRLLSAASPTVSKAAAATGTTADTEAEEGGEPAAAAEEVLLSAPGAGDGDGGGVGADNEGEGGGGLGGLDAQEVEALALGEGGQVEALGGMVLMLLSRQGFKCMTALHWAEELPRRDL